MEIKKNVKKIELLAPAGDLLKLKFAISYGADAVYCAGEMFGLRAGAKNFSLEDLKEGLEFTHKHGKRLYLVLNIIPHDEDLNVLTEYLESIKDLPIDGFILADPGTLMYVKSIIPNAEIHLSTQANNTNSMSAKFWHDQGVKRVVLARELSLEEIKKITSNAPETLEFEAFIHGAMCISYSGRCLLSNYLTGRDANRGDCAQSCRWKYHLVEEKRPGEYMEITEEDGGTHIFNSKDLCMIEHIDDIMESGIYSLKIEGRMKSIHYVSNVVRVYREAIDRYCENPESYEFKPEYLDEIKKSSHRDYTTGFFYNKPTNEDHIYESSHYVREYDFVGYVRSYDEETGFAVIEQRGKFSLGETLEVIGPNYTSFMQQITEMYDSKDNPITDAPHAQMYVRLKMERPVEEYFIIRRPK